MEMAWKKDILDYPVSDVKYKIAPPTLIPGVSTSRSLIYHVPKLDHIWGKLNIKYIYKFSDSLKLT